MQITSFRIGSTKLPIEKLRRDMAVQASDRATEWGVETGMQLKGSFCKGLNAKSREWCLKVEKTTAFGAKPAKTLECRDNKRYMLVSLKKCTHPNHIQQNPGFRVVLRPGLANSDLA